MRAEEGGVHAQSSLNRGRIRGWDRCIQVRRHWYGEQGGGKQVGDMCPHTVSGTRIHTL